MSKTIVIPDIGQNPIVLRINGETYRYTPGAEETVPDEVAAMLAGIVDAQPKPAADGYRDNVATLGDVEDKIAAAKPTGTIPITENGTYDVTQYAEAEVEISGSGGIPILNYTETVEDVTVGANNVETIPNTIDYFANGSKYVVAFAKTAISHTKWYSKFIAGGRADGAVSTVIGTVIRWEDTYWQSTAGMSVISSLLEEGSVWEVHRYD